MMTDAASEANTLDLSIRRTDCLTEQLINTPLNSPCKDNWLFLPEHHRRRSAGVFIGQRPRACPMMTSQLLPLHDDSRAVPCRTLRGTGAKNAAASGSRIRCRYGSDSI